MNILHLFSNYKWTGPAEPAVNLAAALQNRGHRVCFASGRRPGRADSKCVHEYAAGRGLDVINKMRLAKHVHIAGNLADARVLSGIISEN